MCTLILGFGVVGSAAGGIPAGATGVIVAANRDEDPARPSEPPGTLRGDPPLAGGRDTRAGGTWLAVRGREAVVALLNRRPGLDPPPAGGLARRSRGLLVLDVAAAPGGAEGSLVGALDAATGALERHAYDPFTLVLAAPAACAVLRWDGRHAVARAVESGWHVVTHAEFDDPDEPRAAWLLADLAGWRPATADEAAAGLLDRLALHGEPGGAPPVCLHDGRMRTVSTSVVWLSARDARYLHVEGRPCEHPPLDHTQLLAGPPPAHTETP
jgi:hypothetical protein